jgi:hypothetical protein
MCDAIRSGHNGVHNHIFEDALIVSEEAKKNLVFLKIEEDSPTTCMFTTCCGTMMGGTSDVYMGGSIVVPNGPKVEFEDEKPILMAVWTKYVPKEVQPVIPQDVPEIRGDEENLYEMPLLLETVALLQSHGDRPKSYSSFKDLYNPEDVMLADKFFEN